MPTVTVSAKALHSLVYQDLGLPKEFDFKTFEEALDKIAFDYGVEYDGAEGEKVRIEIPANRYDMLSLEGIAEAFCYFKKVQEIPTYKHSCEPQICIRVKASTYPLRPYVVGAVFRGVRFDESSFASFIDLQDKLHQNLARRRTLVSMGTHDLDKLVGDLTYACLPKKGGFNFVPLNQKDSVDGEGMFNLLRDTYLKPYLPIVEDSDITPVVLDGKQRVASVPPIINSEFSKLTMETTNILVEVTALDFHKAEIVLDQLVAFMGRKTTPNFTVEPVRIIYEPDHPGVPEALVPDAHNIVTPRLNTNTFEMSMDYIHRVLGREAAAHVTAEDIVTDLLPRMGLRARLLPDQMIQVECPITRRDVLHACDIAEDVGIALGYNNLKYKASPAAHLQSIQNISERVRRSLACAGWKECLTFALVSRSEAYKKLQRTAYQDPLADPVSLYYPAATMPIVVSEPKTSGFEVLRPSLIPGLLNTLASNQAQNLPIRLFEIGEVAFRSEQVKNCATQKRYVSALIADAKSGLEHVHGLLDTLLSALGLNAEYALNLNPLAHHVYYLHETSDDKVFLDKRAVQIKAYPVNGSRDDAVVIGSMGVVHPLVLQQFGIPLPCSLFELSLEPFLTWLDAVGMAAP